MERPGGANDGGIPIRFAVDADLPAIAGLSRELGYPVESDALESRWREITADPAQAVFVAEDKNGTVIGWVHVLRQVYLEADPFAEIGGLVVAEGQRGRGAGRGLMTAAEGWALRSGLQSIRLRSNVVRQAAHDFYRRIGYQVVKTQLTFSKQLQPDGMETI